METYRLVKEGEYIRLFSNPTVNIQKLPEEERGTNFDLFLRDVLAKTYDSETERATAVKKALQDFLLYQQKVSPHSYDRIRPGQTLPQHESTDAKELAPVPQNHSGISTYATPRTTTTAKARRGRRSRQSRSPDVSPLRQTLTRDEKVVRSNTVLEKRTRGNKQVGKGKKSTKKASSQQKGGWLSWN